MKDGVFSVNISFYHTTASFLRSSYLRVLLELIDPQRLLRGQAGPVQVRILHPNCLELVCPPVRSRARRVRCSLTPTSSCTASSFPRATERVPLPRAKCAGAPEYWLPLVDTTDEAEHVGKYAEVHRWTVYDHPWRRSLEYCLSKLDLPRLVGRALGLASEVRCYALGSRRCPSAICLRLAPRSGPARASLRRPATSLREIDA
ncbi:uncharacterized protein PAN0_016d5264 [Moesziomyces antarcticus]|uniref:Uncharacterized protein n=2 Tax=Pseudozyma antarctica TaxID=84753 RepID=A0A081CK42_PSEA2|nr:uncharacterized protein PAN0_016d5264 [Moesziomyces antarcticus]GAK67038.1 hypothetical protein PAN0_016d5264 [Moesziomyces antarcticus]SPO48285.1 uncharacterized protein PSANT_05974 [Moesziomyces antarcticus]